MSKTMRAFPDLQSKTRFLDLWVFVCLGLFLMFIFAPGLDAKFGLVDDHEIFRFASPVQLSPQVGPPISLGEMIGTIDTENGRVRTVFYAVRFAMVYLLGTNPMLWHATLLLMGLLTAGLFYASLRILKFGIVPSVLGVGMLMLLPTVSYAWVRLGAPENVGTLFLGLAFFAIAKSSRQTNSTPWDIVLVMSALAAALTKESFILTVPALTYARLLVAQRLSRQSFRKTIAVNLGVVILLGLVFVFTLGLLYFRVQAAGITGQGGSSFVFHSALLVRLLDLATNSVWQAAGYVPAILVGLIVLRQVNGRASRIREIFLVGIFPLSLIVPQLLLYATRDYFDSRYWLPAVIGIVFINLISLVWLSHHSPRIVYLGCVVWLSIWLAAFARQTAFQVSWFRADTIALNRMLDDLAQRVSPGRAVVIAADPGIQYEAAISLLYHIAQRGRADIPIYVLLAPSDSGNRQLAETQANSLLKTYFAGHNALTDVSPSQVNAIILFSREENIPPSWFSQLPTSSRLVEYSEPVPTFSFKEGKFTNSSVGYSVLWSSP